jgi:hypothetical protein
VQTNIDGLMTTIRAQAEALAAAGERDRRLARAWKLGAGALLAVSLVGVGLTVPPWMLCREEVVVLERRQVEPPVATLASAPVEQTGRLGLQLPSEPDPTWKPAAEGCPADYVPIHRACWIEIKERLPCHTSYQHAGRCWLPLRRGPRPGVADPGGK